MKKEETKKKKRESPKTRYRLMVYPDQLGCKTADEARRRLPWILDRIKQISRYAGIMHDSDVWTDADLEESYPVGDDGERPVNPDTGRPYKAGDHKRTHFHVCIWLNEKMRRLQLIKIILAMCPEGAHLTERNLMMMDAPQEALMYLTHVNRPHKHQYDDSLVFTNFDWQRVRDGKKKGAEFDEILRKIESGEITRNNVFDKLTVDEFIKYKRRLEDAFEFAERKSMNDDYSRICIYVTSGVSGSGKSINAVAVAKAICERYGWTYFYGGEGVDVWDGYNGQEVIILDDKSFGDFSRDAWLKTFDKFAKGSASSRFKNKVMRWRICIVTNILPFEEQVNKIKALDPDEDRVQFRRRFPVIADVQENAIYLYRYNDTTDKYDFQEKLPNLVRLNVIDKKSGESDTLVEDVFNGFRDAQINALKDYASRHGAPKSDSEILELKEKVCAYIDAQYTIKEE